MDWEQKVPVAPTATQVPTVQATVIQTPTPAIPPSDRVKTIGSITGGAGVTSQDISIPYGYWELTYTIDPLIKGGQDSHSSTGSNSAVFPTFSIQITDLSTGQLFDTVSPDGQRIRHSGKDPIPVLGINDIMSVTESLDLWLRLNVESFTIEVRVPVKTTEQSSSGDPTIPDCHTYKLLCRTVYSCAEL